MFLFSCTKETSLPTPTNVTTSTSMTCKSLCGSYKQALRDNALNNDNHKMQEIQNRLDYFREQIKIKNCDCY